MDTACDKPDVENENVNSNEHLSMLSTEMTTNFLSTANISGGEHAIEITGLCPDVLIEEEDQDRDKLETAILFSEVRSTNNGKHDQNSQLTPSGVFALYIKDKEENKTEYLDEISDDGIEHSEIQTMVALPAESEPIPIDQNMIDAISVLEEAVENHIEQDIKENQIEYLDEISDDGIGHSEICQTMIALPTEIEPLPNDQKMIEEISVLEEAVGNPVGTILMVSSKETVCQSFESLDDITKLLKTPLITDDVQGHVTSNENIESAVNNDTSGGKDLYYVAYGKKDENEGTSGADEEKETGSDYSEIPSEPGEPIEVESTSSSITLAWSEPLNGSNSIDNYEIKYKERNTETARWIPVVTETKRRTTTVPDLKCGTEYDFKIRAVNQDGEEGPFSKPVKFSTNISLGKSIQTCAKKIKDGNPTIFKLPLHQPKSSTNHAAKTRKCTFGRKRVRSVEKTIMLVGATGSGKSTLIDGMINYITDVSWDDDFRFTLVDLTDEEKKRLKNQADSQTEWITCYAVHTMDGSKIDYNLNIIDTPGFGDTRGIVRDKAIVDQIREFFTSPGDQGIRFLDAVCFVTQAPLARLTPPQRYIFDAILSVFGQDIANNIYVLITFADGNAPPVRDALNAACVPFQGSFKFNNSALFASSQNSDEAKFGSLFWKMGQQSFKIFFDELKLVESKSLQLTTEVLELRKNLEATVQGLQPQISEGMNKLNTIRQERAVLKRHKTDIEANRNFIYEVDEIHMRKIDLQPGRYVTNCLNCNRTCHYPCRIPDDDNKRNCRAMHRGLCTVCPKECHWSVHKNNSFRIETYNIKVKKTYEELKRKYEIAQQEEQKHRSVLGKVKNAFTSLGSKVMKMVHDVRGYLNKLNEIALRPNPLSDIDYIDLLIESEKNERKYGWENRVKLFKKMREESELVAKTSNVNFRPWGEDEDIINDEPES